MKNYKTKSSPVLIGSLLALSMLTTSSVIAGTLAYNLVSGNSPMYPVFEKVQKRKDSGTHSRPRIFPGTAWRYRFDGVADDYENSVRERQPVPATVSISEPVPASCLKDDHTRPVNGGNWIFIF